MLSIAGVTRASLVALVVAVVALVGALTALGAAQVVRAMPEPPRPPQPTPTVVEPPTVMATPELVWENGQEPSSPLESDPAVQAVRAALIGEAMAMNTGDFTIAQFTETTTRSAQESDQSTYIEGGVRFYPGPWPFAPVRVEREETETGEEAFRVFACFSDGSGATWPIREDSPGGTLLRERGAVSWVRVLRTPDGLITDLYFDSVEDEQCDPATIPVAHFAEQPDAVFPPDGVQREPVRALPPEPAPPAPEEPSTTPLRVLLTTLLVVILGLGLAATLAVVIFAIRTWPRPPKPEPVLEPENDDPENSEDVEPEDGGGERAGPGGEPASSAASSTTREET